MLFRGASPFVYAGFTGPLTTGTHTVTVTPDAGLSVIDGPPLQVELHDAELEVVAPDNPSYLAHAYAPGHVRPIDLDAARHAADQLRRLHAAGRGGRSG